MPIKPSLAVLATVLGGSVACQPVVAGAPFRARPDTVAPGDLRGPFDGQVVDSGSGKPIEGAMVVASWALRAGRGLSGPAGARVASVETNADGRYRIASLASGPALREVLERFTLVIYKRGYFGWRSDRRFGDRSVRSDFTQSGNVARLERLPGDVSHVRHLAYVGAAGPLLPKVEWELPLAAEELRPPAERAPTEEPAESPEEAHLDGRALLSADELKAVSGYPGAFTVEPLADLPSTPSYDSVHFVAAGREDQKFDAAIRVWQLAPAAALEKFESLKRELPAVAESKDAGDRSFRSSEGDLLAVAAVDLGAGRAQGVVVVFTCGSGLCPDHAQVAAVMRRMWGRIGRLGQVKHTAAPVPPEGAQPAKGIP